MVVIGYRLSVIGVKGDRQWAMDFRLWAMGYEQRATSNEQRARAKNKLRMKNEKFEDTIINSKHEIRNSKQIKILKIQMTKTKG